MRERKSGGGGGGRERGEEGVSMREDRVEDCLLECLEGLGGEGGEGDWLSLVPVRKTLEEVCCWWWC